VVVWNITDSANQDLLCYTVDSGAITAKTDVVTNATDDCGLAAISIDLQTGYWWVFYGGPSTGGSTWNSAMRIYCKVSKNSGATWGPETKLTNLPYAIGAIWTTPRFSSAFGPPPVAFHMDTAAVDNIAVNVSHPRQRAQHQMFGG
jgi:hypothetical protein